MLLSGGRDEIVLVTSAGDGAEAPMVEGEGGVDPFFDCLSERTIKQMPQLVQQLTRRLGHQFARQSVQCSHVGFVDKRV